MFHVAKIDQQITEIKYIYESSSAKCTSRFDDKQSRKIIA